MTSDGMNRRMIVIGGGVVGTATALKLQSAGHRVLLINSAKKQSDHASYGPAGVLSTSGFIPVNSPGFVKYAPVMLMKKDGPLYLNWAHLPKLAPWLYRFVRHANHKDFQRMTGSLAFITANPVAEHRAMAQGSEAAKWIKPAPYFYVYPRQKNFDNEQLAWSVRAQHGITWQVLSGDAVRQTLGGISGDFQFAVNVDNQGIITDPGRYLGDLRALFCGNGGEVIRDEVASFGIGDNICSAVTLASGRVIHGDGFAITAGAYSAALLKKTGLYIPLAAERGYHLDLWHPSLPPPYPMLFPAGKVAITPMHNRVRIAGLVELSDINAPPLEKAVAQLRRKIRRYFPAMTWESETQWMGRRPAPVDSVPLIGAHPTIKGIYMGFGHQHIGLTASAKTAKILAALMSGNSEIWSERRERLFSPQRFIKS